MWMDCLLLLLVGIVVVLDEPHPEPRSVVARPRC